jgi:hypothetical protein
MMNVARIAVGWMIGIAAVGCGHPDSGQQLSHESLSVSAEFDLAPTGLVPAPESQSLGTLVTTPTGYLAVWSDSREAFAVDTPSATRTYFARIAADGSVLDPEGVVLPAVQPAFWTQVGIAGACEPGGTCMLIAHDQTSHAILGIRIAGDQVLDTAPRVLFDAGVSIEAFAIAWSGSAYRVIWRDPVADTISTASLAPDGTFGTPVAVASPANNGSLACQQPGCLIAYRAGNTIAAVLRGRMVDGAGVLGPELMLYAPPGRTFPSAPYWDGQRYWLGLTNNQLTDQNQFGASIQAVRIAADGTVLDPNGILLRAGDPLQQTFPPVLGHDGTTAELIWGAQSNNGVNSTRIARIDGDGTVLDPGGVAFSSSDPIALDISTGLVARVGCHPGACLAVWTRSLYLDQRVHATRFAGITALDPAPIEIANSPPGTAEAVASYAFGHYVALWRDSRDSSADPRISPIRGAVFATALAPLSTIELGKSPQPEPVCRDQDLPAIAASSSSYLVLWHEGCVYYDNIYGQALDTTGQPSAPAFIVASASSKESHPGVASDGNGFLAVWDNTAHPFEILGRRFSATGGALGTAFSITPSGFSPVVAFDGSNYLAVWRRTNGGQRDLFGFRVSPAGAVLGSEIAVATASNANEEGQSIACGGGVCLVAWRAFEIRASRIAPDGSNLDPGGILVGSVTGSVFATSVVWDGAAFVVTWRTGSQLRSQRVAATGALLTTTNAAFTPATTPDHLAAATDGAGHVVTLYDRFDPTAAFHVRRVRALSIVDNDPSPVDAGIDAAPDAARDAAIDGPVVVVPDAAPDAALDAGLDAAPDAAADAAIDAPIPPDAAIAIDAAASSDAGVAADAMPPDAGSGHGGHGCSAAGDPGLLGWLIAAASLARVHRGSRTRRQRRRII